MCKVQDDICNPCLLWDALNVDITYMCGHNYVSIWDIDQYWFYCWLKILYRFPWKDKISSCSYILYSLRIFIFNTDVEYAVSVVLGVWLLMLVGFFLSSSLPPVVSSTNIL